MMLYTMGTLSAAQVSFGELFVLRGTTNQSLYLAAISPTKATLLATATFATPSSSEEAFALHPSGKFVVAAERTSLGSHSLVVLDILNNLTLIQSIPHTDAPASSLTRESISFDRTGNWLFVGNSNNPQRLRCYEFNSTTGQIGSVVSTLPNLSAQGVYVHPDNDFIAVSRGGSPFLNCVAFDASNGQLTLLANPTGGLPANVANSGIWLEDSLATVNLNTTVTDTTLNIYQRTGSSLNRVQNSGLGSTIGNGVHYKAGEIVATTNTRLSVLTGTPGSFAVANVFPNSAFGTSSTAHAVADSELSGGELLFSIVGSIPQSTRAIGVLSSERTTFTLFNNFPVPNAPITRIKKVPIV